MSRMALGKKEFYDREFDKTMLMAEKYLSEGDMATVLECKKHMEYLLECRRSAA
ncbi:MAG: hypothetical protein MPK62_01580 [Alphaproteobacteria bacterium]|nr:hypothetical protein [Alphaproteobacteria bacterium]MDA8029825.1 hypothetical protein [Alphaproteobacteria bacterium]